MEIFHTNVEVLKHQHRYNHILAYYYPLGGNLPQDLDLEPFVRIGILCGAALLAVGSILTCRIFSSTPFFPPRDYRSHEVVNKKDFLYLYNEDELPSKAPVERLTGSRLIWAYVTTAVLAGLVAATGLVLASRMHNGFPYEEEVFELLYWTLLLALWGLRFSSTPYRATIFLVVSIGNIVPTALLVLRDIWPRLLYHPTETQLANMRDGRATISRLVFGLTAIMCTLLTPRMWYPVDPYNDKEVASLEQTACLGSFVISYSWIGGLVFKGFRKDLGPEDLPAIPDYDRAKLWGRKILRAQKSSTLYTLISLMRYDLGFMLASSFFIGMSKFISPWAMRALLSHIENSKPPTINPWVYAGLLFCGPLVSTCVMEFYVFNSTRLIVRVKAALTQSLLIKTMKMRFTMAAANNGKDDSGDATKKTGKRQLDKTQSKVGMINNLMSSDLDQLTDARDFFLLVGSAPIELVFAVLFLYQLLGWASLVGVAMMLVSMVVPGITARKLAAIQAKARKSTDERIGTMNEVLNSIRVVKFFGLENAFMGRIREKREVELRYSIKSRIYGLFFYTITSLLPIMNMLVTFGIYTNIMKKPLSASITFTSISLFNILRGQFSWISFVVRQILNALVSFKRIDDFLHEEEELQPATTTTQSVDEGITDGTISVGFQNATLSWHKPGSETDTGFRLSKLSIKCVPEGLTVISGPVGSGKSSFLLGLLGEMRLLEGEIHMPRSEGVSYVSQSPWLQNATIRDNILFGSDYNEERYNMVLDACALTTDLGLFEHGDLTEVGERGVTLSGGQKARLSLARAVYSPTKIVLLDDVLSALDSGTIKLVFEKCIKGEILKKRTVVLVTHHITLVAPAADLVVVLSDGVVLSSGPPTLIPDLLRGGILEDVSETVEDTLVSLDEAENNSDEASTTNVQSTVDKKPSTRSKLVLEEERAVGRVPKTLLLGYIRSLGGPFFIALLVLSSITLQLSNMGNSFFVGMWSDAYNRPGEVNVNAWLAAYGLLLIGTSVLTALTYTLWYWAQWLAARQYHEKLVRAVLFAPIRFFDTTPMGRIINRFSKDVKSVDDVLGPYLQYSFNLVLDISMLIIVLSGLVPAFLVPTIFVCVVGFICGEMYLRAQVGVKRLVSVTESPLISHFNDTISGVVTIRAFSCQTRFLAENLKRIDDFTIPQQTLYNLNRWIGVRLNSLTAIVGFSAGAIALTSKNIPPGLIGFSLVNALSFSSTILYAVRYFTMLEVELNSLERVNEYIGLKQEKESTPECQPPASWPTDGDVQIRDLSVKYSDDGPDVLHKISFDIKPRERVGVVGRTGAGKSSLALSLLRFTVKSGGSITLNGRDIENVNLDALRQRVTIIPQDPILFSGTIRSNLDPFGDIDDSDLQMALDGSGLTSPTPREGDSGIGSEVSSGVATPVIAESESGTKKITLDTAITAGGENLSQGQRQLLAFARALVRRSKLVILDEATSSTDHKTDERIQRTLKTSFPESSIVCIAHRLRTVMNFDRILVLGNNGNGGEVIEFDTPATLMQNEGGVLYDLAKKSGEFDELLRLALEH